jgi:hypothetical protein
MKAAIIHVHSPFQPFLNPRKELFEFEKSQSVNQIIKEFGISFQSPTFCVVNGVAVLREQWDDPVVVDSAAVIFVALPHGGGDGGSNPLRVLATVAVIVVAAWVGGPAGVAMFGSQFGAAVAAAVVATAGSMLVNILLPPPATPGVMRAQSTIGQASPVYSIDGRGNSARLGQPIPVIYGEHPVFPDYAAQPYSVFDDNDQILHQLFCIGRGDYDVLSPKIGSVDFADFTTGVSYVVYHPGEPVYEYPQAVYNADPAAQEMEMGTHTNELIVNPAGTTISRIKCDFVCGRGLYYANDSGGLSEKSVIFEVWGRRVDDSGDPIGSDYELLGTRIITDATITPIRTTFWFFVPSGRWQVYAHRTDLEDTSPRAGHKIYFTGLTGFKVGTAVYADETLVYVRMVASDEISSLSQRQINFTVRRKLSGWDGADPSFTRNPAYAIKDAIKEAGLSDLALNSTTLSTLAATWEARGDYFDGVFDSHGVLFDTISQIARVGRAKAFVQLGKFDFVRDEYVSLPVAQFSPRNIKRGSFSMEYLIPNEETADEVTLEYFDRDRLVWREVTSDVYTSSPVKKAKLKFFGCCVRDHAYREACYMSACNRKRRTIASFTTGLEGHIPGLLSLILVCHQQVNWGRAGDVVGWDGVSLLITGSDDFQWVIGEDHFIALRKRDGSTVGPIQVYQTVNANQAILASSPGFTPDIGGNRENTQYIFGKGGEVGRKMRIVDIRPLDMSYVQIVAVGEDNEVHTADGGAVPAEPAGWELPDPRVIERPNIGMLWVVQTGTVENPMLNVSWNPAPGANSYIVEYSYSMTTWTRIGETSGREITFSVPYGSITIRVAGYGLTRGDWQVWSGVVTSVIPPGDVTNLALINNSDGRAWAVSWSSVARAERYRVRVEVGGVVKREVQTKDLFYNYTSDMQTADGGPWRSVTFKVVAVNAGGESTNDAVLIVTNDAPTFLGYDPTIIPLYEALKIDWSTFYPGDIDLTHFVIYCDTVSPPVRIAGVAVGEAKSVTIDGLEAEVVHYVKVVPFDAFGQGEESNVVSAEPLAYGASGTASSIAQSVGISDSEGTQQATLDELYNRVYVSGGPAYDRTGTPANDFWIEFDFGVGFLIDLVQVYVNNGGARVYCGVDVDGQDNWQWFGANSNVDHSLTDGTMLAKADQSTAAAAYWELIAGENVALLPPRIPGKRCRLFLTGSSMPVAHQIHELRFERQVHAEQIYVEKLAALSTDLGDITAGTLFIGPKDAIGDPTGAEFRVDNDGTVVIKSAQGGDYMTNTGNVIKIYEDDTLRVEIGELL